MVKYFNGEMRMKRFSLSHFSLTAILTAVGCLSSAVVVAEERQTVLEEVVVTATKGRPVCRTCRYLWAWLPVNLLTRLIFAI